MDFSAPHIAFTLWAYLISAVCILGLCAAIIGRDRANAKKLQQQNAKDKS